MAIPMETTPVIPNAVYSPNISLLSRIVDGQIKTACQITLFPAKYENGQWQQSVGTPKIVYIRDIANLDPDISHLSEVVLTVSGGITSLISAINAIRKLL